MRHDAAREVEHVRQSLLESFRTKHDYDQIDQYRTDQQRADAISDYRDRHAQARSSPTAGGGGAATQRNRILLKPCW